MYPEPERRGLDRAFMDLGKRDIIVFSRTGERLVNVQGFFLISRTGALTIEFCHGTLIFADKEVRSYSKNEEMMITVTLTGESL